METRANYVLVGTFVVIITIGVFAMVMWLGVAQFGAERGYAYDIHFPGAVTGLVKDVPVLENGVPIGRVSKIDLNPERPVRETGFQALAASLPEVLSRINTVGDHLNQLLNEENRSAITDTLEN